MDGIKSGTLPGLGLGGAVKGESPEITALVERAKAGEEEAFAGLIRLYERRIISIGVQMGLSREDALDACQEAFVKVFRYIRRFRSGETFFKWLHRIALNAIYDQMKRRRPMSFVSMEEADRSAPGGLRDRAAAPDERAASADLARKLLDGLDGLSRQERIVFVLRDLQQLETVEIGRILRLSQITVRRHCMAARQKLRARLFPRGH